MDKYLDNLEMADRLLDMMPFFWGAVGAAISVQDGEDVDQVEVHITMNRIEKSQQEDF